MFQNGCLGIPIVLLTQRASENSSTAFMLFNTTDCYHSK